MGVAKPDKQLREDVAKKYSQERCGNCLNRWLRYENDVRPAVLPTRGKGCSVQGFPYSPENWCTKYQSEVNNAG